MNEHRDVKDIIALLDAGYSREEIAEMISAPAEAEAPAETAEEPAEPEAEKPAEAPAAPDSSAEIEELKNEIQELKNLIRKQNLKAARIEEAPKQDDAVTILARLVNPDYGMDGGKIK